ncbi:testis-expressed protein 264 isoform X1 [Anguilla anguilla]|uniref:testis-expressed protein 264 isoform X1 n=1 Tax=Anguilla anguilla TaxID=7936 RepID=UPI0015AADCFA|nr:testis-expressed protein 264 isoform X1 [Anguilla anguilla]
MSDIVILALIVLLLLILLVTIVGLVLYSGLLSNVDIRTGSPPIKNITIAYKFREGSYKECGSTFTESCSIGPKLCCIGVYYDDPKEVPAEKCRCAVGNILSEGEEKPDEELVRLYKKFGFKIFSFPEVAHVVTTTFPNRTPLSCLMGIYKVYPQMDNYIKERGLNAGPFLEIYQEEEIQYICPLACQNDFFVPEACDKANEKSEEDRQMDITAGAHSAGGDSNSETSPVSQMLLSESQETSQAPPTEMTLPEHEPEDEGSISDKNSAKSEDSASSFEELELELGKGQEDKDWPLAKEATSMMPDLPANEPAAMGEGEE